MRNSLYVSLLLLCLSCICDGQSNITVSIANGKYQLDNNKDQYSLPISLLFDGNTFVNKTIAFYSDKKDSAEVVNAKFGSSDLGVSNGTSNYEIKVNKDSTINLKGNSTKIKGTIFFKIDNGELSQPINFAGEQPPPNNNEKVPIQSYKSGSIILDAIKIVELKNKIEAGNSIPAERKLFISILANYNIKTSQNLEKSQNRYLINNLGKAFKLIDSLKSGIESGNIPVQLASAVTSLNNMDVTTIADGFAKFIVIRTKQELSIAFFNNFKDAINKKEFDDLRTVFPQTYKTLSALGDKIYMYNSYIQTLRESFEKDLATLPANLPTILDNHEDFFGSKSGLKLKAILQTGFYLAQQIKNKQHPGNIIEDYPIEYLSVPGINANIKASFQTLRLLSISMKNNVDSMGYWVDYSKIKNIFSDDTTMIIYLGLLEQQAKRNKIVFNDSAGNSVMLSTIVDSMYTTVADSLPKYKSYLRGLVIKIQDIESYVANLKTGRSDSLNLENYYGVVSSSIDLMKYLIRVEELPYFPKGLDLHAMTALYFYIGQTSSDIAVDINRKNYALAIVNAKQLLDTIFSGHPDLKNMSEAFFKYGSFMAALAGAKSSDDVETVIESVVLPAGSSSIKRESIWNFSLNAYGGGFFGMEKISGVNNMKLNSYGVAAPIGICFSKGSGSWVPIFGAFCNDGHWSNSVFISVVDIGALAAFRFKDDSTQAAPNVQLKDIISPGIFYSWGIPFCPFSLNVGWQIGPLLRTVTKTSNTYSQNYTRFSISAVVDIPLFNLYTKPKD